MKNGCSTVAWILFLVIGVSIFYIHSIIVHEPLIPSVKDQWWGKLDVDIDENIYPFGINISEKVRFSFSRQKTILKFWGSIEKLDPNDFT